MPDSSARILGRTQTSLRALAVLLAVAALLFAIPRLILPWVQPAFAGHLDPGVWADYAGPYDLAAVIVAASGLIIFAMRR